MLSVNDETEWYGERNDDLVAAYLQAGVRLAWIVDPRRRTVQVRRLGGETSSLASEDWLDGENVLPGFRLPVAALFRPPTPDNG